MATLGGMLMSKDAIGEVSQIVSVDDFYEPKHQTIYEAIIGKFSASEPADAVTVANRLSDSGDLDKVGGIDYLHSLIASVPTAANASYYAEIVHQRALLRRVIASGTKIAQLGYDAEGSQAQDVINMAQAEVYEMSTGRVRQDYAPCESPCTMRSTRSTAFRKVSSRRACPPASGDRRGDQGPAAGPDGGGRRPPGHGQVHARCGFRALRRHSPPRHDHSVQLEMSKVELAQRIISAETGVPLAALRNADDIDPNRWNTLNNFYARLQDAPLFIDDSPNMSLMEIRAKCRRLKQTNDLKLVVIDYLQLMTSGKAVESRQQEVSEFSRALKLLAKELEVPVVALSQLNRGPEMRNDKKPQLSDLRESGSIEQDADVVFLVHRPDFYDEEHRPGEADIIMAKHRNGPTRTFGLVFQGQYSRFSDMNREV